MVGWGVILLVLGVGSFLMPFVGMQFALARFFGPGNDTLVGIVLSVVGLLLIVIGLRRGRTSDVDARNRS